LHDALPIFLRVLAVVAVGLAVADVDGRAVVHVVVGGVVGVAFQADRGVGDVGVTEVGHVALTEVLHRVLRVDVIALDAGELAGVGRAVDVAGGLHVTVAGGDRAVDLAGVLHRLVTGVGLRHPEVVAVDDLPAVVGQVLPGGLGAVAHRVDVGGLDVAVEVTVDVHVGAVVDVGGVVLVVDQLLGDVLVAFVGGVGDVVEVLHHLRGAGRTRVRRRGRGHRVLRRRRATVAGHVRVVLRRGLANYLVQIGV